ncbi:MULTISPECIES: hypothetical protein [Bacillus]|uniref:hypothetical protein n=1 Tax=Bacillus TaxID=1386 RepID=UPI0007DAF3D5|nr:hypothetical protein [Bacillus wiedmannii]MED3614060.1 hypothetical protein [Bacillus wiedmannii]OAK09703.1 hypothetical protein A6280_23470 [Bacillus wiedmannii]
MDITKLKIKWNKLLFDLKIHSSDGQEFENLFCKIMQHANEDFLQVDAYGKLGDGSTDGYIFKEKVYYQCYGPRAIKELATEAYTKKKLNNDFESLLDSGREIKKYYFVVNDKFKGISQPIREAMDEINNIHDEIEADFIGANKIKNIFFEKLTDEQIEDVLGINPLENLDFNNAEAVNIRLVLKTMEKYLINKIDALDELNPKVWIYKNDGTDHVKRSLDNYHSIIEGEIYSELIQQIENLGMGYKIAFKAYLNDENKLIELLIANLNKNSRFTMVHYNMDYSNFIFSCLRDIINLYNEFSRTINEVLGNNILSTIDNKYLQINKQIGFETGKLEKTLEEYLNDILNSEDCRAVYLFADEIENSEFLNELQKLHNNSPIFRYNYSKIGNKKIIKYLTSVLESISTDIQFEFSPHIQRNHVIFIKSVFNKEERTQLEELQNRSDLAIYNFFEN